MNYQYLLHRYIYICIDVTECTGMLDELVGSHIKVVIYTVNAQTKYLLLNNLKTSTN